MNLNDLLPDGSPWELQWARAINESGMICGEGRLNDVRRAFVFSLNTLSVQAVPLLPDECIHNEALDINESDHVAGWARGPGPSAPRRAYLWNGSAPIDLGALTGTESVAHALNNSDEVVGWSGVTLDDAIFAIHWQVSTVEMSVLDDAIPDKPQWKLTHAAAINDQGWIASYGRKTFRGSVTWNGVILIPTP